jgi:hypothetical protein
LFKKALMLLLLTSGTKHRLFLSKEKRAGQALWVLTTFAV